MSIGQLRHEAQKVGRSGGITCLTPGVGSACATPYMRRLTYELVKRSTDPAAWGWAQCVINLESGFNPAAISQTGDHGVGQINYVTHTWIDRGRISYYTKSSPTGWASDVLYSVALFERVSNHGRDRSPWRHNC